MVESDRKPPAFFCPSCGQKHRADLTPLAKRPGAFVRATCRRCNKELRVHLEDGRPVADLVTEEAAVGTVSATGGPYEAEPPRQDKPFAAGERVGRYTVKGIAQQGRTSTVYRAHDPTTKRSVALKVLRGDAADSARKHFVRQVEVQANIRHPNIMPVYDRGTLEDGRPYFTMELLHRPVTLADLLERRTAERLSEDRALAPLQDLDALIERIVLPVADGIYVANIENGVIHGDLRPQNILVDGRSLRPYVMDFGRSHELEEGGARTQAQLTPFLSPEQARGWVYARTDVWGLGALLHTVLSGRPPLTGTGETLRQHALAGRYTPLDPQTARGLAAVARKAMSIEPDARYVNARQMAADLKAWRAGGRVRAVEEFGGPGATSQETRQALRHHLRTAAFALGGVLVGLLVGSRFEIGGEDPGAVRIQAAQEEVDGLDSGLTRIQAVARTLGDDDAHLLWQDLEDQATRLQERLDRTPASPARSSIENRLAFVRERFTPLRVRIEAPAGLRFAARGLASDRVWDLEPGDVSLPPGRYRVSVGSATFPARVPFSIRQGGTPSAQGTVCATWSIPVDPARLPTHRKLVVGCPAAQLAGPPLQDPMPAVAIPSFAMDGRLVTNADWATFLAALPAPKRAARVPATGFEESGGQWRARSRSAGQPVTGLRPDDARAYCAWRSREEGHVVRLPSQVEWLYAAGLTATRCARGDLARIPPGNAYGIDALGGPAREMTIEASGDCTVHGAADAEAPLLAGCAKATRLANDARKSDVGFRCVQELPQAP